MSTYTLNITVSVMADMTEQEIKEKAQKELWDMLDGTDYMGVYVHSVDKDYDPNECEHCGSTETTRNSSGELQCDNCGHSETA